MSAIGRVTEDRQYTGDITFAGDVTFPASVIESDSIDASNPVALAKQRHKWLRIFAQAHGVAATAERRVVHIANVAGVIDGVRAGVVVANIGAAVITIDVKKNGTTIVTGTFTLTSAGAAYAASDATLATTTYVADDVFEVIVTVAAGGGTLGQGLFVELALDEGPG